MAAVLSNIIWGSSFLASKIILIGNNPIFITVLRFLIAAFAMFVFGLFRKNDFQIGVVKNRCLEVVLLGLVGYSGLYYFQMTGLKTISSSHSAAVMLLAPIVTLVLTAFINKTIKTYEVITVLVSFLGAFLVLSQRSCITCTGPEFEGLVMTVFAAICLGVSVLQTKNLLRVFGEKKEPFTVFNLTFYSILVGVVGLIILSVFGGRLNSFYIQSASGTFWSWLFYLGLVCSVFAFLVWNWAIKYASSTTVAISMYLKTPVAFGLGAVVLSEKLDFSFYFGSILILVSLVFNQFYKPKGK